MDSSTRHKPELGTPSTPPPSAQPVGRSGAHGAGGKVLPLGRGDLEGLALLGLRSDFPAEVVPAPLPPVAEMAMAGPSALPPRVARLARLDRASLRRPAGPRRAFREERLRWRVEGLAGPFEPGILGGRIVLN